MHNFLAPLSKLGTPKTLFKLLCHSRSTLGMVNMRMENSSMVFDSQVLQTEQNVEPMTGDVATLKPLMAGAFKRRCCSMLGDDMNWRLQGIHD
ncbi:hypothetical protein K1719_030932 [Acacia pycnantha]|nr:hypothetical protein K1719_030932 [Acacia pycnantha]